jgi:hypothetical protein
LEQQPLKNAVLQGFSLKNRKSLQAQAWSKTVRFSAQSISFGTGSFNCGGLHSKPCLPATRLLPFFVGVANYNRPKGRGSKPNCE